MCLNPDNQTDAQRNDLVKPWQAETSREKNVRQNLCYLKCNTQLIRKTSLSERFPQVGQLSNFYPLRFLGSLRLLSHFMYKFEWKLIFQEMS